MLGQIGPVGDPHRAMFQRMHGGLVEDRRDSELRIDGEDLQKRTIVAAESVENAADRVEADAAEKGPVAGRINVAVSLREAIECSCDVVFRERSGVLFSVRHFGPVPQRGESGDSGEDEAGVFLSFFACHQTR